MQGKKTLRGNATAKRRESENVGGGWKKNSYGRGGMDRSIYAFATY